MIFLILPNQLFDIKYFDKSYKYIIWECPHFFTDYNYNKKKLLLHRASMKYQYDRDTPNLLLSLEHIKRYRDKTDKFFFNAFYMWSKKELDIIPNIKSQDKLNRQKPKNIVCIAQPYEDMVVKKEISKYIEDAKKYIEKHFKNNCGNLDKENDFIYPITRADSLKWLEHFIKNKIKNYGNYQDYIDKNNRHLCHSLLSALINIGLINPIDIINILERERKTRDIPMNSYEGFIRQLFWREYQHYCYLYVDFSGNYFGNNKLLTKEWYSGNTGVLPVDDSIREAFETGYLHHIKRLMVIGNYMNLCNIRPREGFRWFMEFSCDSYEWVMYQNVYDMVFFTTGGKTMRRPYISSSNYILNMSNYSKDKWCEIWNDKYRDFIKKNKKKLWKYRYYVALK